MSTEAPPDYTAAARLLTLFGCVPLGMAAHSLAQQASTRFALGDAAGAWRSAARARTWCWAAAIAGALTWVLGFYALGEVYAAPPPMQP